MYTLRIRAYSYCGPIIITLRPIHQPIKNKPIHKNPNNYTKSYLIESY